MSERRTVLFAAALLTAACHSMSVVRPAQLTSANAPSRVWLTRADHSTVVMESPQLVSDTLRGLIDGMPQRIPLAQTTLMRVRHPAPLRTAAVVLVASGAGLAALMYLESRPYVGNAMTCYDGSFDQRLVRCCLNLDTAPC